MKKRIVWVNGCFDLLHRGHLHLLQTAREFAHDGIVIVGIDTDERIKVMKGGNRPIISFNDRAEFLRSLKFVDRVVGFNSDEELEWLIRTNNPDFLIVGEEYKGKKVIGSEYAKQIVYVSKLEGYSTTNIIQKIKSL